MSSTLLFALVVMVFVCSTVSALQFSVYQASDSQCSQTAAVSIGLSSGQCYNNVWSVTCNSNVATINYYNPSTPNCVPSAVLLNATGSSGQCIPISSPAVYNVKIDCNSAFGQYAASIPLVIFASIIALLMSMAL